MATQRKFVPVDGGEAFTPPGSDIPQPPPAPPFHETLAFQALMLSLKVVGQRALVAVSHLFTAASVASVWALCYLVLHEPNTTQLVGIGLYATFVLAVELIRRRS